MASELLKVSLNAGVTNSESVILNGVNGHTYTILSVIITETAGAAETVDLYIDDGGGAALASSGNVDITVSYLDQTR